MTDKINEFMKKCTSSEKVLKRIAFYLLLLCILLSLIFFKLYQINENILLLSKESSNPITPNTTQNEYESVKDIFIEEETKPGDVIPLYDEIYDNSLPESTTQNSTETLNNNNETEYITDSTTVSHTVQNDTSTKTNFVININSKKIHYADCSFVNRMKEENKKSIQLSNIELKEHLNSGYTLCSTCGG